MTELTGLQIGNAKVDRLPAVRKGIALQYLRYTAWWLPEIMVLDKLGHVWLLQKSENPTGKQVRELKGMPLTRCQLNPQISAAA